MGKIETLANELQQQMPHVEIVADAEILRNYAVDGILPRLIVTPTTVTEATRVIELTQQHHLTLLPRGGGSRTNLGGLAEQIDVMLITTRLTHLLEHEAPDLTCHVEAGITLAQLQQQLATKGQRLSLDAPGADQATIGGLLATNASGPKRLRYGTARDLVIGLKVIQASGEVARSGGRVVKNVAGYDLNKLYIGSLGTLGVIVEANFKLHPLPASERTLLLTYTTADDVMRTVMAITRSSLTPSAIELIDARAANDMSDFFGFRLPTNGYTLAVNFEGSPATIERQINETHLLARKYHVLLGDDLEGEEQERFWEVVREHIQGSLTCKVSIPVSQIAPYLQTIDDVCQRHDLEAATIAHAGNGILYVELRPSDALQRLVPAIYELRITAQEERGSLVVERCPVDLKRRISIWGEPRGDFPMMQRLKQQFDPEGTFVRGRFLGGL
ncbi:glycolate oxidase [Reticulibacter mediterranei]|uniref:Glycolate oxidase n=1 Tax=Reticulibacter mediterranei TaxID=2778369 RepID=A0A8J3II44_9CHLR|nr:FAD-binding oxidoreductase [Reticulibacter mediterranei]GHO95924.1 glycolate oxidase [Reticulibacter mediterranei]